MQLLTLSGMKVMLFDGILVFVDFWFNHAAILNILKRQNKLQGNFKLRLHTSKCYTKPG